MFWAIDLQTTNIFIDFKFKFKHILYRGAHNERKTESDRGETEKEREFNRETFDFWMCIKQFNVNLL